MHKKEPLFKNRVRGARFAIRGAILLVRTEPSIKVQFFIALILSALGFLLNISSTEWMIQLLAIALVMGIEALNTAIEKMADFVHPEFHEKIGFIKDISAGAVMIVSVASVIVGCIIYLPKILALTSF